MRLAYTNASQAQTCWRQLTPMLIRGIFQATHSLANTRCSCMATLRGIFQATQTTVCF